MNPEFFSHFLKKKKKFAHTYSFHSSLQHTQKSRWFSLASRWTTGWVAPWFWPSSGQQLGSSAVCICRPSRPSASRRQWAPTTLAWATTDSTCASRSLAIPRSPTTASTSPKRRKSKTNQTNKNMVHTWQNECHGTAQHSKQNKTEPTFPHIYTLYYSPFLRVLFFFFLFSVFFVSFFSLTVFFLKQKNKTNKQNNFIVPNFVSATILLSLFIIRLFLSEIKKQPYPYLSFLFYTANQFHQQIFCFCHIITIKIYSIN